MADAQPLSAACRLDAAQCYAAVAGLVANFLDAAGRGDAAALAPLLDPIWQRKGISPDGAITIETRDDFLTRMQGGGAVPGAAHLSCVQACFGDFAIARLDHWESVSSAILLVFKVGGAWRIAGEAHADASAGGRSPRFRARDTEREVLDVLEAYYRAVTGGDPAAIREIFAPCWSMTNHEAADIVSEGTDAFVRRLEEGPLPTYWDDRQIADVQIIANQLAYVRVDKPSTPSTTVFMFARAGSQWQVIDKAWADGRI